jgi:hypothetical protein
VETEVRRRLEAFLAANDLSGVAVDLEELPTDVLGLSGKFRQVIGIPPARLT